MLVQGGGTNLRIHPINVDVMNWVEAHFVIREQVGETSNGVPNQSNSRPMYVQFQLINMLSRMNSKRLARPWLFTNVCVSWPLSVEVAQN